LESSVVLVGILLISFMLCLFNLEQKQATHPGLPI
jgi:hypothetical protein